MCTPFNIIMYIVTNRSGVIMTLSVGPDTFLTIQTITVVILSIKIHRPIIGVLMTDPLFDMSLNVDMCVQTISIANGYGVLVTIGIKLNPKNLVRPDSGVNRLVWILPKYNNKNIYLGFNKK